ncbi:hypothetical protein F7725_004216, partial [Dissostichus mawsoni]
MCWWSDFVYGPPAVRGALLQTEQSGDPAQDGVVLLEAGDPLVEHGLVSLSSTSKLSSSPRSRSRSRSSCRGYAKDLSGRYGVRSEHVVVHTLVPEPQREGALHKHGPAGVWYLIHGDFSVPVIRDAGQAEACQVHGVFRQILGDGVGVCVFEFWEPVQDALVFPHGSWAKHLFGEDVQQLVVDGQVSLHAELRHLLQSGVDELHVAAAPHVLLDEHLHHFVKRGLGFGLPGNLLKQVVMDDQRLVLFIVVLIDELCRDGLKQSSMLGCRPGGLSLETLQLETLQLETLQPETLQLEQAAGTLHDVRTNSLLQKSLSLEASMMKSRQDIR